MSAATAAAFVSALHTQMASRLENSQELATVKVFLVPPAEEVNLNDSLIIVAGLIQETQEFATQARTRDDVVLIPGQVQAFAADREPGAAFQTAMNRAGAIVDELIAEVRDSPPQVGRQTRSAHVSGIGWMPSPFADGGWIVRATFTTTYTSRVT